MAIGILGLAFLAGCLSVLSPCVLPLAADRSRHGRERASVGPARAGRRSRHFLHRHRPVRRDRGLCHGPRHRCVPSGLGGAADRRGRPAVGAAAARAICRGGGAVSQWAGGYLDNFAATGLAGQFGLGLCSARCGARASARLSAPLRCSPPRAKIWSSGDHYARVRYRRRLAADAAGFLRAKRCSAGRGELEAGRGGKTLLGVLLLSIAC